MNQRNNLLQRQSVCHTFGKESASSWEDKTFISNITSFEILRKAGRNNLACWASQNIVADMLTKCSHITRFKKTENFDRSCWIRSQKVRRSVKGILCTLCELIYLQLFSHNNTVLLFNSVTSVGEARVKKNRSIWNSDTTNVDTTEKVSKLALFSVDIVRLHL